MGGLIGAISSGTATTIVANSFAGSYADDYFNGWKLVMPDAANAADVNRVVTDYTSSTATFTWAGSRTDTTYTSENFEVYAPESPGYAEINEVIDRALARRNHTVRVAYPTLDSETMYAMPSWVRGENDIDLIQLRQSPNILSNSDFASWDSGPALAPSLWTLAGAGGTIARSTTGRKA